jgi:hypothetical protein
LVLELRLRAAVSHRLGTKDQHRVVTIGIDPHRASDPDPLHGIAQLLARWAAAFVLDPDGLTKTTALGADRMARRLGDALPEGDHALRAAVWSLARPMPSPRLASLNADAFLEVDECETTVDLAAHRCETTLDDLDLDDGARPRPPRKETIGRFALSTSAARSPR